ncbi:ATP-binding protein [Parvibacter caecicola]|uniref:Ferredoxin n=1 Tax=Parvibacter caecicola TaxID=747645 RepID=A0A4T9T7B9_9ACTN|nr:4Fe-4S binding protein [Parvibacter caecicola]TJW10634.1 ferredoxin [Parvibacter caecicola]
MLRRIIQIDEEKCDGCGLCATACHEGAIALVDGKARLMREDFCDGLGDCLPACPTDAISFVEREATAYDEAAVMAAQVAKAMGEAKAAGCPSGGCPGSAPETLRAAAEAAVMAGGGCPGSAPSSLQEQRPVASAGTAADGGAMAASASAAAAASAAQPSQLAQWPCQIKLVPVTAPFFNGAKLLIAADCTAYAYANFHQEFMAGRITLIGCPKLDGVDYSEKLTNIIANNAIESVEVLRMDVPCCSGLENAAIKALQQSGKFIPWAVITIGRDGQVLDRRP